MLNLCQLGNSLVTLIHLNMTNLLCPTIFSVCLPVCLWSSLTSSGVHTADTFSLQLLVSHCGQKLHGDNLLKNKSYKKRAKLFPRCRSGLSNVSFFTNIMLFSYLIIFRGMFLFVNPLYPHLWPVLGTLL